MTTDTSSTTRPPLIYKGQPRDIDAIKGQWTQVVIHGGPTDELISQTKNDQLVRVLLLALALKSDVTVEYLDDEPPRLTAATLALSPTEEDGQVQRLSLNEKDCHFRATIIQKGLPREGWTTNEQVQSVITAATREAIPLGADIDPNTNEIVRAKINVPVED